jgi:arylsulfatase
MHNDQLVATDPDPATFTGEFTERTIDFIDDAVAASEPFFVLLSHPMPHIPLAVSPAFEGISGQGLYGDVIAELDWSVGQVLDALDAQGVAGDTLVILSSDNGPWLFEGGRALPLRAGKATYFDGGTRVPTVAQWPGVLDAGRVVQTPAMIIDLVPTFAQLIGAPAPALKIDGKSIWQIMTGESYTSPHDAYYFYYESQLIAMRQGRWKLRFPHDTYLFSAADATTALYDLRKDPGESNNLAALYPDIVLNMDMTADTIRAELGDDERGIPCTECRAPGGIP